VIYIKASFGESCQVINAGIAVESEVTMTFVNWKIFENQLEGIQLRFRLERFG
jgi:hypothetical protein